MRGILAATVALVGCGRVSFDAICGVEGPCVQGVVVNAGAEYAIGPRLAVDVRILGDATGVEVRVSEDCDFADTGWQPAGEPAWIVVEPIDGVKRVCGWARDATGAVSEVASDTIVYETEHMPVVESIEATTLDADRMLISWTVADVEGIAGVELAYTSEDVPTATWTPITTLFGTGTRLSDVRELAIPTTEPFVVRVVPIDRAGNRGMAGVSNGINTGPWNVYMGTRDRGIGGAARSAVLSFAQNTNMQFAIDPTTHDVYAEDRDRGIIKVDAHTGVVERFIAYGSVTTLPDDGPLTSAARVRRNTPMRIGPNRKLYVSPGTGANHDVVSGVIYQIDLETGHCRRYLGGGTANDATATPSTVFAFKWLFDIDEDGSLYFLTSCTPGVDPANARVLKATQLPDGRAGTISIVAGNCATGTLIPGGPYDALTNPLPRFAQYKSIGSLTVWDRGRVLYMSEYPGNTWKLLDGKLYSSSIRATEGGTLAYDRTTGTLLATSEGSIERYQPNLAGADGDALLGTLVTGLGTGDCTADDIAATEACISGDFAIQTTAHGAYFVDGPRINQERTYRVRFVDTQGRVQTYVGSRPRAGDGTHRLTARGNFAGIHFKRPADANQAAFGEGLYFTETSSLTFGHVDPGDGAITIEWGNGHNAPVHHATGTQIGPMQGLGISYDPNMAAMAFDRDGLPWLRYGSDRDLAHLVRVDTSRAVVDIQSGMTPWEFASDTTDPATLDLWPYTLTSNLTLKDSGVFLLGGYANYSATGRIRLLDFTGATSRLVMGTGTNAFTPDRTTPGTVQSAAISDLCMNGQYNCFTQYVAASDRLYFSEGNRLRYITTPSTPASSTLITALTDTEAIYNFTIDPTGSVVFWIRNNGTLVCHDFTALRPWCNDTPLGPPVVFGPIGRGANQLTWRDNRTLLISTYLGAVLQYQLPP